MASDHRSETVRLLVRRLVADGAADDTAQPTTLVVFELQDAFVGTQLTITESGYDQIPLARRAAVFTENNEGWTHQIEMIEKYLVQTA